MNVRFLFPLAVAVALAGCSGGGPGTGTKDKDGTTDTNTHGGTDTTTPTGPTGDTGTTGGTVTGSIGNHLLVQAFIVFDGATQTLVDGTDDGNPISSSIFLIWGTDAWQAGGFKFTDPTQFCIIQMPLTSSKLAKWGPPGTFYAVDYDGGVTGVQTTCGDADHPMDAVFGAGADFLDILVNQYGPWGAGIGPPTTLFDDGTGSTADIAVGGLVNNAGLVDPTTSNPPPAADITAINHYAAFPLALDPTTFEVLYDGTTPQLVPQADVFDGTSLATAYYEIFDGYTWTFQTQ